MTAPTDLAGLLCSRLCHDLISPVGAIGNGLELVGAAGGSPEDYALLSHSASAARATLGYMRLAFGAAGPDAPDIGLAELGRIAADYFADRRQDVAWPEGDAPLSRGGAKLLLLLLLAGATATPRGGSMTVAPPSDAPLGLSVAASGPRAGLPEEALALLVAPDADPPSPREAHLTLLARAAREAGGALRVETGEARVALSIAA